MDGMFDVWAINIETLKVRLLAENKTERNAFATMEMAVIRRGLDEEFYSYSPSGKYKDGDKWGGEL